MDYRTYWQVMRHISLHDERKKAVIYQVYKNVIN